MSNAIRYDPLLTAYLADELNERLEGRACASAPLFAPDRSATLAFGPYGSIRFDLHPLRGWTRLGDPLEIPADDPGGVCAGVQARDDDRVLDLLIDTGDRFRDRLRTLSIELQTNQWNAILHEDGRIVNVLRGRQSGGRSLFPGQAYLPPPPQARFGVSGIEKEAAWGEWRAQLGECAPDELRATLISRFACTGTLNADWILLPLVQGGDESDGEAGLARSFRRWWWLRSRPAARPCLLRMGRVLQPYPLMLDGVEAESSGTLLDAMGQAAAAGDAQRTATQPSGAHRLVEDRLRAAERRVARLREQFVSASDSAQIRGWGDLLLARIADVPRGNAGVTLEDWDGRPVEIPLDPTLTPAENAAKLYQEAKRKARAGKELPGRIESAEREVARWTEASASIAAGETPAWVGTILEARPREQSSRSGHEAPPAPYRAFRTSGGLEVRVGRNSRDNDRLTFKESAPNDVWLHARSVAGSHVILRWPHPDASPPARDLGEAAQLAAVFSRARTSSTVAVDWTRRKHVRKPRGSAPGLVVPQRVKTLFVEPDPAVVDRLALDPEAPDE